jgi:hypothetical protein
MRESVTLLQAFNVQRSCLAAVPCSFIGPLWQNSTPDNISPNPLCHKAKAGTGAGDEARTRDPHLGKVTGYFPRASLTILISLRATYCRSAVLWSDTYYAPTRHQNGCRRTVHCCTHFTPRRRVVQAAGITPRQASADAASAQRPLEERSKACARSAQAAIGRTPHCGRDVGGESAASVDEPWLPLVCLRGGFDATDTPEINRRGVSRAERVHLGPQLNGSTGTTDRGEPDRQGTQGNRRSHRCATRNRLCRGEDRCLSSDRKPQLWRRRLQKHRGVSVQRLAGRAFDGTPTMVGDSTPAGESDCPQGALTRPRLRSP